MRKIIYSGAVKCIAVILFVASIVCGVLIAADGVFQFFNQEDEIYGFERDFSESWYISSLLSEPEHAVFNAYHSVFYRYDDYGNRRPVKADVDLEQIRYALVNNLEERFSDYYYSDMINYYVQWNDHVLTNCGAKSAEELMQGEYYSYLKREPSGYVERRLSGDRDVSRGYWLEEIVLYDKESTIIICCNVKEDAVAEYKAIWELQEAIVFDTLIKTAICAGAALLALIYLLCVCGMKADGQHKSIWLDNIWLECHLAAVAAIGIGGVVLCVFMMDECVNGGFPRNLAYPVVGTASGIVSLIFITSLLSVIRNIKVRRLVETSIILRTIKWCFRLFVKLARWFVSKSKVLWSAIFHLLSKKTGVIIAVALLIYTALIINFGMLRIASPIRLFMGILLFGFAVFIIARRAADFDEIRKGVSQVRNGNVAYKIPELKSEDMKELAANINDIAVGLDASVSARVKAERLKTELITNVSHDLKTPITSIINYTQLLSEIAALPEEARDYVAVIAKKSDRLNRLTQDLFAISKVQSGNDAVVWEKLDVSLLISQALGEHDNEIQSSGLPFCVTTSKELFISADGRKMSRVLSNLIQNILKYTMKNTRVFITASEIDETIQIELKNISAYPLNFNVEEITQRFVRGDESRSAEGNGLGLAIAKSYTEICNGTFDIVVDGDMFKAILKFKKYRSENP